MQNPQLPIKKTVAFQWQGQTLTFDVAQELFSSHQVDHGSRQLLNSLDHAVFPATGRAADFGCGYGVLGIAWQAVLPRWTMHYVDRDALAVAFSRHNAIQLPETAQRNARYVCDVSLPESEQGNDLVLWNVPGKAGHGVIAGLLDAVVDGLAAGGVLAAVVVHPLAGIFADSFDRSDAIVTHSERGKEHTVVHIRKESGDVVSRRPFDDGVFDREPQGFSVGDLSWRLAPVVGLPEYDSLNHATELAATAMIALRDDLEVGRWMVIEPGVGHLAMVASLTWPNAHGQVLGRDALAIRATARALGQAAGVQAGPVWGIEAIEGASSIDLIVVALPEQASAGDLEGEMETVGRLLRADGTAIFHGGSTEVARLHRVMRRRPEWRMQKPVKLRGSAAVTARHRRRLDAAT